ncbi:MAG: hypothetical protein ACE5Q6_18430 [Dehalococcoidia bacterium]
MALGGGGYELGAVARCWALAYGVMLDAEWPDQIPNSFTQEHGLQQLRDTFVLDIPTEVRQEARRFVEEEVGAIKRDIFPIHKLGG